MTELLVFNLCLIALAVIALIVSAKNVRTEKSRNVLLLVSSVLTIVTHYSSVPYHLIIEGSSIGFLRSNPNLLLPIYPCNVVMWCCLLYGILLAADKAPGLRRILSDYIFWFGIIACLVGMFANVDFIRNPGFGDFDTVKSVVAHAFMLYNILLTAVFGHVKIDLPRNMLSILLSVVSMLVIGMYCNLLFEAVTSHETAYNVNSMLILHSPFEEIPFLRFPIVSVFALVFYFMVFSVCEFFRYRKGNRWISRIRHDSEKES